MNTGFIGLCQIYGCITFLFPFRFIFSFLCNGLLLLVEVFTWNGWVLLSCYFPSRVFGEATFWIPGINNQVFDYWWKIETQCEAHLPNEKRQILRPGGHVEAVCALINYYSHLWVRMRFDFCILHATSKSVHDILYEKGFLQH